MRRGPSLFVTVDPARGLALVRGRDAVRVVRLLVPAEEIGYSRSARGWTVPADYTEDLVTYGELYRELVIVSRRTEPAS